jgi:hypothetical protein
VFKVLCRRVVNDRRGIGATRRQRGEEETCGQGNPKQDLGVRRTGLSDGAILPQPKALRYRPAGLKDLPSAPADLNAFTASLAVIASDVFRWEIPPDAAATISAEAITSSFGASVIERKSYSPNVKYRASSFARLFH